MQTRAFLICAAALVAGGCGNPSGKNDAPPPPAAAPVRVRLAAAGPGEVSRFITLPAEVRANQQAVLYAKVAGYLKSIAVDRGDSVHAGQIMAEIEAPELLADQSKSRADLEVAKLGYDRLDRAGKSAGDLVLPLTVDEARGRLLSAEAALKRVDTLLGYAKIVAPFDGVITRRWVDPGALVPAATSSASPQGAAVLTLMDFSTVRVLAGVPENEAGLAQTNQPVRITLEGNTNAILGKITRSSFALDESVKTMMVEIELPNPKLTLRPGMFATARIQIQHKSGVLTVPSESVLNEKGKMSVFSPVDGRAKKIPVKIGFDDGTLAEVVEGLTPGQTVLLAGKAVLADGQAIVVDEK